MLHQYETLPKVLEKYRVGNVPKDDMYLYNTPLAREVKQKVKAVLPPNQWWAPASWYGCLVVYRIQCGSGTVICEYFLCH